MFRLRNWYWYPSYIWNVTNYFLLTVTSYIEIPVDKSYAGLHRKLFDQTCSFSDVVVAATLRGPASHQLRGNYFLLVRNHSFTILTLKLRERDLGIWTYNTVTLKKAVESLKIILPLENFTTIKTLINAFCASLCTLAKLFLMLICICLSLRQFQRQAAPRFHLNCK